MRPVPSTPSVRVCVCVYVTLPTSIRVCVCVYVTLPPLQFTMRPVPKTTSEPLFEKKKARQAQKSADFKRESKEALADSERPFKFWELAIDKDQVRIYVYIYTHTHMYVYMHLRVPNTHGKYISD